MDSDVKHGDGEQTSAISETMHFDKIGEDKMNRAYVKQLVDEAETLDPQNEVLWQENYDKRFAELSRNLDETISYLDTCSEKELDWMSELLEALSEHFGSQKLIACVERNMPRCSDPALQAQLKTELEYMRAHL